MKKFKIIFFDCDGILTFGSLYERLNKVAKVPEDLDKKWLDGYYQGKLSFALWLKYIDSYYQKNLTYELFRKNLQRFSFNKEAIELIKYLKVIKIKTAIISSGVDYYVGKVAKKLGIDYWRSNSHLVFDGNKFVRTGYTNEDPKAKVEQIKEICKILNVRPTDTMFVGDSANDILAFKLTKHGVLYRTNNKEYEKYAWKKVKNLKEIIHFLDL